ncbi:MAG: class I tRNA ligase family protein, partial [bacterium]|nr:class I tRNA ligase family protein [bacterium]MDZ4296029.1 class I tRNA ligase family protein [Patescibacteria group bacterium]
KNFKPLGTGVGPLASVPSFYKVACPKCRREARRETDVSDAFLDSAWYFLRYPSVRDARRPWTPAITGKWLPVDMYIGGAEHSVLHLLYARFLTMAFHDWGILRFEEPFTRFRAHGLITKDGAKMSKSKGNVVNPDEYFKAYGADAMRMYLAFLAPFEQNGDFQDTGIRGITRFLERVWKLQNAGDTNVLQPRAERGVERSEGEAKGGVSLLRTLHQTIKKVTEDVENLQYNTAISALMTLLNAFEEHAGALTPEHVATFLKLLAPFAPHLTEELWQRITARRATRAAFQSIHCQPWPRYDEKLIRQDTARIIIQVNGKVRDQIEIAAEATEEAVKTAALERENVRRWLDGKKIKRIIVVPKRLINIVIG